MHLSPLWAPRENCADNIDDGADCKGFVDDIHGLAFTERHSQTGIEADTTAQNTMNCAITTLTMPESNRMFPTIPSQRTWK